jgi:hypothetical protein
MDFKKRLAYAVTVAILLLAGLYFIVMPARQVAEQQQIDQTSEEQPSEISYQGEEGKTALELLRDKYDIETESFSFGEMVVAINGIKPSGNQFWAFYINDNPASVGAGDYQTQNSDVITWKLEG